MKAPSSAPSGHLLPKTVLSVALLLEHLGRVEQARAVEAAVAADLAERGDASRSTTAVGDAIAARLA